MTAIASPQIQNYFDRLEAEVAKNYQIAAAARKLGLDPEENVPIPVAKNMAERVVGLISVVAPQVANTKIVERIMELEKEFNLLDWRVGFKIAEEVAQEKFCQFANKLEAMEIGIRTGFAYLTLGIVSAPLEGFIGLKIKKRKDGQEYFALQYASPIRAAGGTAAATSVILCDYVRLKLGYASYDPDEKEVNRYAIEIGDYHERVTNLQYLPSEEELKYLVSHLPVEVDGDPTEEIEVSNYKDLPRIETNKIRGGVALVLAEGLCQKSAKLWKRLSKWGKDLGLEWDWLNDFLKLKEKIHARQAVEKKTSPAEIKAEINLEKKAEEKKKPKPNNTFLMDLVAGRPILTYPLAEGGFRLRYGRTRTSGFSAAALNPATLIALNKFIAIGTQMKVERPGKAATVTVCDTIDGPIIKTKDGSVYKCQTEAEMKQHFNELEEIIFLGDILFNYGDFSENGQDLVPAGYCPEWWSAELEKAVLDFAVPEVGQGNLTAENLINLKFQKVSELTGIIGPRLHELMLHPLSAFPGWEEAVAIGEKLKVSLHPEYTFFWRLVSASDLKLLIDWFKEGKIKLEEENIKIFLQYFNKNELHLKAKRVLELLGVPHKLINKENLVIDKKESTALAYSLGFKDAESLKSLNLAEETVSGKNGLELVSLLSSSKIRDKAGTFIGARMGRPEKAKMRLMTGSPQVMFPVGEEGDRLRSFQACLAAGKVTAEFPFFFCSNCQKSMIYRHCEECREKCETRYHCRICGDLLKERCKHGQASPFKLQEIDINYYFNKAKERLGEKLHPDLIKGVRGTSNKDHLVEHLAKGILRAKHNIYVNKDGTTRYDCTELPITHFKPKEIKTSIEKLKELGYLYDILGKELVDEDQVLELKPQDLILPGFDSLDESAPKVLSRIANFIDELLAKFYGLKSFYNIKKEEDLVGHLVVGLAPHISAGLIGRIIGFSETQGLFAHPMYHAGLRRDCDGDEACLMLLLDALLNFSRKFLSESRGGVMDAPLVLTSLLNPTEIDDQVHGLDTVWKYPLELYEASLEMKKPWEAKSGPEQKKVEQISDRLRTVQQYEGLGFTHPTSDINKGILCSAYKILPTMEEKLAGQMEIAKKVRAVDLDDVAKLVIQKHFLKDIRGNLRKFSMQQFRCVKCNSKFRRPPLSSKCSNCGGKLIFTITEGSVLKYLNPSLILAEKYDFSAYLKQTLSLLKVNVDHVFGKEKEKQSGLGMFMG